MIKTQDLPSASTLAQNDTLVANVGGKTKKVPVSLLTSDLIRDGDKSVAGSIDDLQERMSASSASITALQSQSAANTENIKTLQNVHKSETHSIPITGWATHALDGTTYYAYAVTLSNTFSPDHCSVSLAPTGTNTLPTTAEAEAYNRCFATLDGNTLRVCAAAVPGSTFTINVTGVKYE